MKKPCLPAKDTTTVWGDAVFGAKEMALVKLHGAAHSIKAVTVTMSD